MLLERCCCRLFSLVTFLLSVDGRRKDVPPEPKHPDLLSFQPAADVNIPKRFVSGGNVWEHSGLFEGDIMLDAGRNVLLDQDKIWPGVVPVYVNETDFESKEVKVIRKGMERISSRTCIKFRQYKEGDSSFIVVRGNSTGCWSHVGMKRGGQTLHLQRGSPGCVRLGVVMHEFLHALGLYHQQSEFDRDDFVRIEWQNIEKGKEHNFQKYNSSAVTTYNLTYDYASIMHYSQRAFSKNGETTITPLKEETTIGQRKNLSDIDVLKLQYLYNCKIPTTAESPVESEEYSEDDLDYDFDNLLDD